MIFFFPPSLLQGQAQKVQKAKLVPLFQRHLPQNRGGQKCPPEKSRKQLANGGTAAGRHGCKLDWRKEFCQSTEFVAYAPAHGGAGEPGVAMATPGADTTPHQCPLCLPKCGQTTCASGQHLGRGRWALPPDAKKRLSAVRYSRSGSCCQLEGCL